MRLGSEAWNEAEVDKGNGVHVRILARLKKVPQSL